jgi:hypothetical protein
MNKPTDWIQITTGFNGRAIHGSYAVEDVVVKVKTPRGERETQVEGVSNPIWLAVWLLRELAKMVARLSLGSRLRSSVKVQATRTGRGRCLGRSSSPASSHCRRSPTLAR